MSGLILEGADFDPDAAAWQVEELLDRSRVVMARTRLTAAIAVAPGHPGLLLALARADWIEDRYADARDALRSVLIGDPANERARLLMCLVAMEEGELAEAEDYILGLLRESPRESYYFSVYSRLMLRALHFEKASQLADEALRLAPHDASALRVRALCDLADARKVKDNAALVRLIAAEPHDLQTLQLVFASLQQAGYLKQARALAREMLLVQPDNPHLLALVHETGHQTHWTMWPLRPLQRWGWHASIALWVAAVIGGRLVDRLAPGYAGIFTLTLLSYVVYSWVWPPLLRKWMSFRA